MEIEQKLRSLESCLCMGLPWVEKLKKIIAWLVMQVSSRAQT